MKAYAPYKALCSPCSPPKKQKKAGSLSHPPYILFYRKKGLLFLLLAPQILARTDRMRAIVITPDRRRIFKVGWCYYVDLRIRLCCQQTLHIYLSHLH